MSSSNGAASSRQGARRAVRFAPVPVNERAGTASEDDDSDDGDWRIRNKKRPRVEYNNDDDDDEMDPDDNLKPGVYDDADDQDAGMLTSERNLLHVKRQRRLRREQQHQPKDDDDDDDQGNDQDDTTKLLASSTRIDQQTSLAAEGIEIEPFHMNTEQNDGTGYFDGDTYVFRRNRQADEEPDAWLESLDDESRNNEMAATYSGAKKDDEVDEQRNLQNSMDDWTEEKLYASIVTLISNDSETVMQAIVRYGNLMKQQRATSKKQKKSVATGETSNSDAVTNALNNNNNNNNNMVQTCFNQLTEASNALLLKGKVDIYQATRRQLLLQIQPTEQTAASASDLPVLGEVQWEYQGSQDGKIHGPFSTKAMLGWTSAGYFVGASAVQVRTVEHRTRSVTLQEDLLADLEENDDENGASLGTVDTIHGEWQLSDTVDFTQYR